MVVAGLIALFVLFLAGLGIYATVPASSRLMVTIAIVGTTAGIAVFVRVLMTSCWWARHRGTVRAGALAALAAVSLLGACWAATRGY